MTIWLMLLLVPYLCFTVIGELPHQHGHPDRSHTASLHALCSSPLGTSWITNEGGEDNDGSHCPICIVQAAFSACASVSVPQYCLPVTQTPETAIFRVCIIRTLPILLPSRAPPELLS